MARTRLPTSGAISLADVAEVAGLTGTIDMTNTRVRTLLNARNTSGPVSLQDGYGRGLIFQFERTQFLSGRGSNVFSPQLNIRNFFAPGQLQAGQRFEVTSVLEEADWGIDNDNIFLTAQLTLGVSDTRTTGRKFRKQNFNRLIYGGGEIVQSQSFYSGDSTNFPNSRVRIASIRLLDV